VIAPAAARTEAPSRRSLAYLPAIDGLRGIALVGILLYHDGRLDGAFLSVDLFFALSGFLITSLLVAEVSGGSGLVDLRRFWSRRLRRLLPASLVTLAAVTLYAGAHLDDRGLGRFRGDALAALGNVANWRSIVTDADYWANQGEPPLLRHMWTLSLEEQVYLALPLIVFVVALVDRRRGARPGSGLLPIFAVLYVGSVAAMAMFGGGDSTMRAYYGTDTRAHAVLVGAIAALLLRNWRSRASDPEREGAPPAVALLAPTAAAALAIGWLVADGEVGWIYRGGFAAWAVAAGIVVTWCASAADGPVLRAVGWAPLRWLGSISYGGYLVHWPIFVATAGRWSPLVTTTVRLGATVVLAVVSLYVVERPIRSGRVPTRVWRPAALASVLAVAALVVVVTRNGDSSSVRTGDIVVTDPAEDDGSGAPLLLLVGDSQAVDLGEGAPAVLGSAIRFAGAAAVGCGIGPGLATAEGAPVERDLDGASCLTAVDRFVAARARLRPDVVLLHAGAWDILDRSVGGEEVRFGSARWDTLTRVSIADVLAGLQAPGTRVVALAAPCFREGGDAGQGTFGDVALAYGRARTDERRVERWNELLREEAARLDIDVLPYDELFCDADEEGDPVRPDGVHLDEEGAEAVWRWILPRLGLVGAPAP
jgi:peptidoglycan/LPS O-acetylase OafA/YrhL/lysophospholipase L1-like esterase